MKQTVLIFAKNLIHGEVKTRLAATAGNDVAFSVYEQLIKHTVGITSSLPVDKTVFYSKSIEPEDVWDSKIYRKKVQSGNDLGERMRNAFAGVFVEGYEKAAIIGTDCMELNSAIIIDAFACLDKHEVVIGPAKDGGYYLLAMKKLYVELFENINWSTHEVFSQTLEICKRLDLSTHLLPELSDIDDEDDLNKSLNLFLTDNGD